MVAVVQDAVCAFGEEHLVDLLCDGEQGKVIVLNSAGRLRRTLFVDGYDSSGNRVYDKVSGQTCHQCRQKTLGRHTACSECRTLHVRPVASASGVAWFVLQARHHAVTQHTRLSD